jgi:hypothetical protein
MGLSLLLDFDVLDGWDHELSQRRWNRFAGFKTTPASQHYTEENTLEQGDENTLKLLLAAGVLQQIICTTKISLATELLDTFLSDIKYNGGKEVVLR